MRHGLKNAIYISCVLALMLLIHETAPRKALSKQRDITKIIEVMSLGRGAAREFVWRPDGNAIAVGGTSGVWLYTPDLEDMLHWVTAPVMALYWHPDGSRIVTLDSTGATIWDATSGQPVTTILNSVGLGGWNSRGSLLAIQGADGRIQIWGSGADKLMTTCAQDDGFPGAFLNKLAAMAWSPTEEIIAISDGRDVMLCDANTGRVTLSGTVPAFGADEIAWSQDGTQIAVTNGEIGIWTWEVATGGPLIFLQPNAPSWHVRSPAWNPDGSRIAAAIQTSILIWNSRTHGFLRELTLTTIAGYGGFGYREYRTAIWSPDGSRLLTGTNSSMQIIDSTTGKVLASSYLHTGPVNAVAWNNHGQLAVAYGDQDYTKNGDYRIRLWDSSAGILLNVCLGHIGSVNTVAWSPEGTRLVSGGGSFFQDDGSVIIWDTETCEPIEIRSPQHFDVHTVAWNPNGAPIAVTFNPVTLLCDDDTLVECKALPGVSLEEWSPDGAQLAGSYWGTNDYDVITYDINTEQFKEFSGHTGSIRSVRWSPEGNELASGAEDNTVRIWNTETGDLLATLEGHEGAITSIAWSPDGSEIASSSADHSVRVWDVATGQMVMAVENYGDVVTTVAWSPDGSEIATGSLDGIVRIYSVAYGS